MTTVNYKKLLLLATLPAMMLASCSKEEPGGNDADSRTPVAFIAVVQSTALPQYTDSGGSSPATRTALDSYGNTVWTAGDVVSISMLTSGGTLPDDIVPGGANVLHNVDPESGALTPADGTPMYYPQNTAVDFIAWHTSKAPDDNYILTLNTTDQTTAEKQLALDPLYSKFEGVPRSNNLVVLHFRHLMSKVKFDITLGLGLSGGTLTDVRLAGFPGEGSFDMRDGSVNKSLTTDEPVRALKSAVPPVGADAAYTALLIPQAADSPRTIAVTVNGKEYTGTLPATDAYAANTMYTYPVIVRETGVEVGFPTTDVPWTESELLTVTLDNKPFRIIRTAADLKRFADDVNGGQRDLNALQTADIDLSGIDNWDPINYADIGTPPFTGIYNGNGYTISHLRISHSRGTVYNGLFGLIGNGALLTGIHLRDVEIMPDYDEIGVGTLAGAVRWGATVALCSARGKINASGSGSHVGGLVGTNTGTVTRCRTDVTVTADETLPGQLSASAGGIAGINEGLVFACHATGSVTLEGRYKDDAAEGRLYAGGIAGINYAVNSSANIYCCIAEGDVSVILETEGIPCYAGGLAGFHQEGIISSSYASGNASVASSPASRIKAAGAIVGRLFNKGTIEYCYGAGTIGVGTSNISPDRGNIVYNTNPRAGEILTLMKDSHTALTVPFTRYDPDATPAYGMVVQNVNGLTAKEFWLPGDGTWPVIDFARNTN